MCSTYTTVVVEFLRVTAVGEPVTLHPLRLIRSALRRDGVDLLSYTKVNLRVKCKFYQTS